MIRNDEHSGLIAGLNHLKHVPPPMNLVAKIMRDVQTPRPPSLWQWLTGPKRLNLSFSPLGLAAGTLAVAVVVFFTVQSRGTETPEMTTAPAPAPAPTTLPAQPAAQVLYRFVLTAQGAQKVSLAGDFNQWDPQSVQMAPVGDGRSFVATILLPRGQAQQYMFVVDGQWVSDPSNPHKRPDGFGRQNSLLQL